VLLPDVDDLHVRRLGTDEHRYRSVRWFRDELGGWRRREPWISTIVNDCGQVLGIVDGRDSAAVGRLAVRPQPGVAGPDRGRSDRSVGGVPQGRRQRPSHAKVSVDGFYLVQLADLMVTLQRAVTFDSSPAHMARVSIPTQ
jgi:hypothetical protein